MYVLKNLTNDQINKNMLTESKLQMTDVNENERQIFQKKKITYFNGYYSARLTTFWEQNDKKFVTNFGVIADMIVAGFLHDTCHS